MEGLRPADEATLQRLRPLWASYGMPLPAAGPDHLVEVQLSDDPDAPTFPYPPCCVLSRYGLLSSADKLVTPAVQGVLAKLRGGCDCMGCGGYCCGCRWWVHGKKDASLKSELLFFCPACCYRLQMTWRPLLSSFWETSCAWQGRMCGTLMAPRWHPPAAASSWRRSRQRS